MSTHKNIVFAGNPNVGKSTVFNALTGLKQHTGNWSGKTVDLASGIFTYKGRQYDLYDIPGTYSVISNSPEEEIARNHFCFSDTDLIVVVADATCMERNLNLALQILEINKHVVLCVNLIDEARRNHIEVDTAALQKELGIPAITISARSKRDISRLKEFIADHIDTIEENETSAFTLTYPKPIEDAIAMIAPHLDRLPQNRLDPRFIALKLLDNTQKFMSEVERGLGIDLTQYGDLMQSVRHAQDFLYDNQIPPVVLRDLIVGTIVEESNKVAEKCVIHLRENGREETATLKVDQYLTSRAFGIPIMICFLGLILWITISGANYPSEYLAQLFEKLRPHFADFLVMLGLPAVIQSLLVDGIYSTVTWITAVMLPPMAIFFPLFTLLEDLGYLPRIAFNLDKYFKKAHSCGKQALTMCMGLGCNAVGVTGCRIISSPSERIAAILTNTFMPCNGRFSLLITLSAIFIGGIFGGKMSSVTATIFVMALILFGVAVTLGLTRILSVTLLKSEPTSFTLELPPYRKPQIMKTITRSVFDRTLFVLGRALVVAAPAGIVIWLMANIQIGDAAILTYCGSFLDPFAKLMGLDGYILLAFILAMPANEIVLPIIIMCYMASTQMTDISDLSVLKNILSSNGWSVLTAVNVMLFSLLHYPCATTLLTIKKETGSWKWTALAFLIPTLTGVSVCLATNGIYQLVTRLIFS